MKNNFAGPPIMKEEVETAIKKMKHGKDNISVELIEALEDFGIGKVTHLLNEIYDSGEIPTDLSKSIFIALPKKPGATECELHRTISLMSQITKILLKIIMLRIRNKIKPEIAEEQCGFVEDKGTSNAIYILRTLIERALEAQKDVYLCFIDYTKAFDRVRHNEIITQLKQLNIDGKDLRIIKTMYWEQTAAMRIENKTSTFQDIKRGVRQGCVLSPDLFSLYIPSSETGVDLDALDEKLSSLQTAHRSNQKRDRFWAVVYLVTVFSNPTGLIYAPDKCKQLVKLARKHNVLLVIDDVYNLMWFPPSDPTSHCPIAPARVRAFDKSTDPDFGAGHVVSVGTFSKYLSPGIRLGWLETSDKLIAKLTLSGLAASGGSFNHYMSKLITWALKFGLVDQHLAKLRIEYKRRMDKMCDVLENHLPKGFKFVRPQGGFYLWLEFPKNVDTFEFAQFSAERYGIIFIPGVLASPTDGCYNCARLSISGINEAKIETGIKEFCMAYKDYCMM
ncbi:2-aminoadipate transaminase [Plakobranchus ocellatus]|uniref:2-aminoadipate transaminase n=1 Tax=Plakobranchus ocellatus TaxID=259542 RepID=A0AAV3Z148_9GAST|nr:2-aminoadipate transaminase [Plakobranchus ocellatus]